MFLYKKNQQIDRYVVVFPHKEGRYAQTYRVKDSEGKVKFLKLIFHCCPKQILTLIGNYHFACQSPDLLAAVGRE